MTYPRLPPVHVGANCAARRPTFGRPATARRLTGDRGKRRVRGRPRPGAGQADAPADRKSKETAADTANAERDYSSCTGGQSFHSLSHGGTAHVGSRSGACRVACSGGRERARLSLHSTVLYPHTSHITHTLSDAECAAFGKPSPAPSSRRCIPSNHLADHP